jgi:hypothetical protein
LSVSGAVADISNNVNVPITESRAISAW